MKKEKIIHIFYCLMIFFAFILIVYMVLAKTIFENKNFSVWLKNKEAAYRKEMFIKKSKKPLGDKILIVTFNLGESGAPLMFLELTQILHQKGYNVSLLSYAGGNHEEDLKKANIPYLVSKSPYYNLDEAEQLFGMFDIVISGRIPQIHIPSQEYKFIWWDHGLLDCAPKTDIINATGDSPLYDLKFLAYQAKDVVFVSELQQNKLADCIDISSEVIHNGINPTTWGGVNDAVIKQIQEAKKDGKTVFVTVGYIDPIKGQDVLVEAVKLLPEEYLTKTAFFVVGADRNIPFANRLRKESENVPQIVWTGPVLHKNIGGVYESGDVLLVPSMQDTAPLVVQEAAEHNMPSVITNQVGSTFIIENNKSGFIIPTKNPQLLAEKIMFFVNNPNAIEDFGNVSKENYDKHSSLVAFTSKWEDKINRKLKEVKSK